MNIHFFLVTLTCMLCIANVNSLKNFGLVDIRRLDEILQLTEQNENLAGTEKVVEEWFEQKLDHFDPQNTDTWQQRYFYNMEYFDESNEKSPIFLHLHGEAEAEPRWLLYGQIAENYARRFGAGMLLLEHRYYGKSQPIENMAANLTNAKYLSSKQALEDAANFIEYFSRKFNLKSTNKWIVFGGSYAGSLAAWMRLKYPHLVSGAVASSAPVKAVYDNREWFEMVGEAMGEECSKNVRKAIRQFDAALKTPTGIDRITKMFNLCERLNGTNELDVSYLMYELAHRFADGAPYGNYGSMNSNCKVMRNKRKSALQRFAQTCRQPKKCYPTSYEKLIVGIKVSISRSKSLYRPWDYQTCTEFGYFPSSGSSKQPFRHFSVDFLSRAYCTDVYDKKFDKEFIKSNIDETNRMYGGTDIQVSNVVFVNGDRDSWHRLSVINQTEEMIEKNVKVILIPGASHCKDMASAAPSDRPALKNARKSILASIKQFLE